MKTKPGESFYAYAQRLIDAAQKDGSAQGCFENGVGGAQGLNGGRAVSAMDGLQKRSVGFEYYGAEARRTGRS